MATTGTRLMSVRYGLVVVMLACLTSLGILTVPGFAALRGDVNDDKTVNVFDALLTLQYAVGLIEHTAENNTKYLATADVAPLDPATQMPKGDAAINVFDALAILRHAVNLDPGMQELSFRDWYPTAVGFHSLGLRSLPVLQQPYPEQMDDIR